MPKSLISKMTQQSKASIRSKAVPADTMFKADVETAKERNERTRDEAHQAKFDRWAQRQAAKRSRSVLDPVG